MQNQKNMNVVASIIIIIWIKLVLVTMIVFGIVQVVNEIILMKCTKL